MSDPGDETDEPPEVTPVEALPADAPPAGTESAAMATPRETPEPASSSVGTPAVAPADGRINPLALVSFACGAAYLVVGVTLGYAGIALPWALIALPVLAVVLGYVARGQIWRNRQSGRLWASAGVMLGYVGIALVIFGLALRLLTAH